MINISNIINSNNNSNFEKNNSILIIGKGLDEYKNKSIEKIYDMNHAIKYYGEESDLTKAFYEAFSIGARNIYICNCYKFTDFIEIADHSFLDEFSFITPLFNFSETFSFNENRSMFLYEFYSNILNESIATIIATDKHASLYEDINQYIRETNSLVDNFKSKTSSKLLNGSNLCFVTNNLRQYDFANVVLASLLVSNDLNVYPQKDLGDVIYDLKANDFYENEIAYFSYDSISKTSIENFYNFNYELIPEKYVLINLVKNDIVRSLDFSNFTGKLLAPNVTLSIQSKANEVLNSKVGKTIQRYTINNIGYVRNKDHSVNIVLNISILPFNSIEELNIVMEV